MWAAGYGRAAAVELLLVRGADAGLQDDRGKTAFDIATEACHKDAAGLLRPDEVKGER